MTISLWITLLIGIGNLAIQFWVAKKPVETKLRILRWAIELSCTAAILIAFYFVLTTNTVTWPFVCACYNFIVQSVLFRFSPLPISRSEILAVIASAVFFSIIPMSATTGVLSKAQVALMKAQYELAQTQTRMLDLQDKATKIEADLVASLKGLVNAMPLPAATPTPSQSPSPTPH